MMIQVVDRFYREIWEQEKREVLAELCHPDFTFRGSLGIEKNGYDEFWDYVLMVRAGLSDYFCEIGDTVSEANRVFAKMRFGGKHTGRFLDFDPTESIVSWNGAALFTFRENRISDLWVLGDLHSLTRLLEKNAARFT